MRLLQDLSQIMVMSFMTKSSMNRLKKLESVQYNAEIAMIGAIRGTDTEQLYQELELALLRIRIPTK